ncbi:ATP-binding protein [Polaromonas hydrogenivorans]
MAIGWVQTRQSKQIDSTIFYNEENISWVFFQLEQEFLALRDSLRQAERYPRNIKPEALRERYEIFVSRVSLVQSMRISPFVAPLPEHGRTVRLIRQFIARADAFLSENSHPALTPEVILQLLSEAEPLGEPIHDMSLLTTEVMVKTISNRNAAAREQVHISIALTIFQGLLTLAFAALLIRQVRSLEKRSHELGRATDEILLLNSELEERVRRRTAQLEAANQELEAFSYSVSHDLRSPLKTIDGFSHLLERIIGNKAGDKGTHYLNRIRTGVRQMGELIDGLLSLAQLSRDRLQIDQVDLTAIARRLAQECQERDPDRQAQIRIQDEMLVTGDGRQLLVVMQNLLGNAWKFTSKRPLAQIEVGSKAGAANETVYFVKDNGAGFDMAYAEKLFGTFERLHSPLDFAGTGIGLATVKRVIERHGGRVWAEGKESEGAVFYFTLNADR